jgi:hypothetical protein
VVLLRTSQALPSWYGYGCERCLWGTFSWDVANCSRVKLLLHSLRLLQVSNPILLMISRVKKVVHSRLRIRPVAPLLETRREVQVLRLLLLPRRNLALLLLVRVCLRWRYWLLLAVWCRCSRMVVVQRAVNVVVVWHLLLDISSWLMESKNFSFRRKCACATERFALTHQVGVTNTRINFLGKHTSLLHLTTPPTSTAIHSLSRRNKPKTTLIHAIRELDGIIRPKDFRRLSF